MVKEYPYGDTTQLSEHFNAKEFQCKCGKPHSFFVSEELIANLEILRSTLNCRNIHVSSGYRCHDHDIAVGGSGSGKHTKGLAADVICYDQEGKAISSKWVSCKAQDIGFKGIANITKAYTSTHLDMREGKKWYGDETRGTSWACNDFYTYYGIPKDNVFGEGVDISYCQPTVDWSKVDIDFCIIKAGQRDYTDKMFESHYKNATNKGIDIGAYWFLDKTSLTIDAAKQEALEFLKRLKGKKFSYPVFLDIEYDEHYNLGKEQVSAMIRAFLETVEQAGYWVGLYTNLSWLNNRIEDDIKTKYTIWLAQWANKPTYKDAYGLWQTGTASVNGFSKPVDHDYCYIDYPTKIKEKGLNGYGDQPIKPECPYPNPTSTVKEGDTGDSVKWVQWYLTQLNYFNDEILGNFDTFTLGAVLAFQLKNGLEVDGKCGAKTRQALVNVYNQTD